MKLSQLVDLYQTLEDYPFSQCHTTLDDLSDLCGYVPQEFEDQSNALKEAHREIENAMELFVLSLDSLKGVVKAKINDQSETWSEWGERLFHDEMIHDTPEHILNRKIDFGKIHQKVFQTRIQSYSDWRYPGMIIRPGSTDMFDNFVGSDPLYLVDTHEDLLKPFANKFNDQYKGRLCQYVVNDRSNNILGSIPDGQIGMCVAYNVFNFCSYGVIVQYMREIFHKLRDGGMLIMTINNSESRAGVDLCERFFTCYSSSTSILREAQVNIGYRVAFEQTLPQIRYIELKKPGKLTTIRGGQNLAKVRPI